MSTMKRVQPSPRQLLSCNRMVDKIDALAGYASDRELEERAKLPRNKLNKVRTGHQFLRADEIWRIAYALRVSVIYLLDDELDDPAEVPRTSSDVSAAIKMPNRLADWWTDGGHKPSGRKPKNRPPGK